jgi:hypothetical protein
MRVAAVSTDFPVPGETIPRAVAVSIVAAFPFVVSLAGSTLDPAFEA